MKLPELSKEEIKPLEEEAGLEEKLNEEMPLIKFKRGDPFELAKGGWGVSPERLKELLEED